MKAIIVDKVFATGSALALTVGSAGMPVGTDKVESFSC
jgi:hypothetical protein